MDSGNPELHIFVFKSILEFALEIDSKIVVYHPGCYVSEEAFPVNGRINIS